MFLNNYYQKLNDYIADYGFAFAVGITDVSGAPLSLDPSYLTLNINQVTVVNNSNSYKYLYRDLGYKV